MKKEYTLVGLIGLYILTYVLDAVVDPFQVQQATPYHYLSADIIVRYPFTMVSVFMKAFLIFMSPLWLFSFFNRNYGAKAVILFVTSGLLQLYAIQQIATGGIILPLEWTLALAYGGGLLLIPTIGHLMMGLFAGLQEKVAPRNTSTLPPLPQHEHSDATQAE